jgi:hypothetical protein
VSAQSASVRRGWLSALVTQLADYVFEEVEETVEPEPVRLEPHPVIAIVSAAPRSGATTVARLLAAELAARADGAAVVTSALATRRSAPPSRAAIRLTTALAGAAEGQACGRLCIATGNDAERLAGAARYLAPVVLDLPPDGSAAGVIAHADRVAVIASGSAEPALLDAVATVLGCNPLKVVNRAGEPGAWAERAQLQIPDSRIGARAAGLGTRAAGRLGSAIAALADALEPAP